MRKCALGIVTLAIALVVPSSAVAQGTGDVLNEAPLIPIPQDMTYEEYQDMNRRISTGLMRSAISGTGYDALLRGGTYDGKVAFGHESCGRRRDCRWGGAWGERGRFPGYGF